MATKNYMINDKWLDIDKQNIVELQSVDGEIDSVKVNGEDYGGGGGSSDFSTAEVTINAPESAELTWGSCPMLLDGALNGSLYVESLPATIIIPLYNGKCVWDHDTRNLTLSGNIEELYEGEAILITGDCTITIS